MTILYQINARNAENNMKRTPRSVKKSCDRLFSQIIRSLGFCVRCGSKQNLQCCHIYSRKYNSVRFDEQNAVCLCARCHRWGHDNPTDFTKWLETFINLDRLREKRNKIVKYKLDDWLQLEAVLKQKVEAIV